MMQALIIYQMKLTKNISITVFCLFYCLFVTSQNNKVNCVTYKIDRYTYGDEKEVKDNELLRAFRALEYELIYNDTRSIYKPVDKLYEGDSDGEYQIAQMLAGYYFFKDIVTKEKMEQSEIGSSKFYVIKEFEEYKWEISSETKIIDGYTCYKATSYKEDYSELRGRVNKFFPTVWFAPSIPAPFGPYGLDGLPGLVLEGTFNGRIYFYATHINRYCDTKIELQKPTNGKYVTEKEFSEISTKNAKENLYGR